MTNVSGEWWLALRDLEYTIGLDGNNDGVITWDELRSRRQEVTAYALSRLHVRNGDEEGTIRITDFLVDNLSDGAYVVLPFVVAGIGRTSSLEVSYKAFFDVDPLHRGLLRLEHDGPARLSVFSPETCTRRFEVSETQRGASLAIFVKEGIWHIWTGYDHILFLLALLLPGVLRRVPHGWEPVQSPRTAFANVLKIVTAFTIAHSITLSLAALGLLRPPTRLVESAIAASVVLAAVNNLVPFFAERGWMVAFGFGLVHGFGFANALGDLGLRHGELALTLLGFNVGVELGQLAIVAVALPLSLALRHLRLYQSCFLRGGSVAILTLSATWLAERVFDFKWLPF